MCFLLYSYDSMCLIADCKTQVFFQTVVKCARLPASHLLLPFICCMKKLTCLLLLFLPFFRNVSAQDSSCHLRISLLTCAPGAELYSTFGHTALRIQDSTRGTDIVYNYGTFDFNDPHFYTKFIRGKLDYSLSVDKFPEFMYEYQYFQRSVQEQEMNLTCAQKQEIITALNTNLQGSNRYYKYDFIYDNCTTRVRDLIFRSLPGSGEKNNLVPEGTTARNLIHSYLDKGGEPWSKLGIDILLGEKLDKPVDNNVAMFLPEYLLKGIDSATINNTQPVVRQKQTLLNAATPIEYTGKYVPLIIFTIICGLIASLYFLPYQRAKTICRLIDSFLLYLTGLLGLLLLFMWWGTDHRMTKDNFNLLWALPTNIIAVLFLWKKPLWLRNYFYVAFVLTALLLIGWWWLPQELNISLVPLVFLMLYRYGNLAMKRDSEPRRR